MASSSAAWQSAYPDGLPLLIKGVPRRQRRDSLNNADIPRGRVNLFGSCRRYSVRCSGTPQTAGDFLALGERCAGVHDFDRALAAYKPDYPNTFNNRGAAYMASGQSQKAIPEFTRALELKPGLRNAYVNRANDHLRLGHIRPSLADFHRAGMHPERIAGAVVLLALVAGVLAIRTLRRSRLSAITPLS